MSAVRADDSWARRAALLAALVAFSALAGRLLVTRQSRLALIIAAIGLVVALFRPQLALLGAIPALLFSPLLGSIGTILDIGVPFVVLAGAAFGILSRKWTIEPLPHVVIIAFGTWLFLSYAALSQPLQVQAGLSRGSNLITVFQGLVICAAAASIKPPIAKVLKTTAVTAIFFDFIVLSLNVVGAQRGTTLELNPNHVGLMLVIGIAAGLACLRISRNPVWLAPVVMGVMGLGVARSREAVLMTAAAFLWFVVAGRRKSSQAVMIGILVAVVLAFPAIQRASVRAALGPRAQLNLTSGDIKRKKVAGLAVEYARQRPLTGIGYNLFPAAAARDPRFGKYLNTHGDYVRLAAETGVPGLILFATILGLAFFGLRQTEGKRSTGSIVLVVYLVNFAVADTIANPKVASVLWIVLGCGLSSFTMPGRLRHLRHRHVPEATRPHRPVPAMRSLGAMDL